MKSRVLIVSSANMDLMMKVKVVPPAGQTVLERDYDYIPGGKGANSALAFAKLGADSVFCTRLGKDANGQTLKKFYDDSNIDTRFIKMDDESKTGLAIVMVESTGANRIVVYPGANYAITADDVEEAFTCYPDAVFMQCEIPFDIIVKVTEFAKAQNIPVIIDAGPANKEFELEKLARVDIFSPNETETEVFTGIKPDSIENCLRACRDLEKRVNAKYFVLKLGGRGVFIYDGNFYQLVPTFDCVEVVDTTAAGDAFSAAMTLEYIKSGDIKRACTYGNIVGTLTVSKKGASTSIPTEEETARFVVENQIDYKL